MEVYFGDFVDVRLFNSTIMCMRRYNYGNLLYDLERYDEAEQDFRRAVLAEHPFRTPSASALVALAWWAFPHAARLRAANNDYEPYDDEYEYDA